MKRQSGIFQSSTGDHRAVNKDEEQQQRQLAIRELNEQPDLLGTQKKAAADVNKKNRHHHCAGDGDGGAALRRSDEPAEVAVEVVMAKEEEQVEELPRRLVVANNNRERRILRIVAIFCCAVVVLLVAVVGILVGFILARNKQPSPSIRSSSSDDGNSTSDDSVVVPPNNSDRPKSGCVPGLFYFTYDTNLRRAIGALNVSDGAPAQFSSSPDCALRSLTIDHRTGTAYGVCLANPVSYIASVNLQSGETTRVANFPSSNYHMLAYNPADDHLYTTVAVYYYGDSRSALVRIEKKNWTFTTIEGGSPMAMGEIVHGMAFDPGGGTAFATADFDVFYALNWTTGTSSWLLRTAGSFHGVVQNIAFDGGSTLYGIAPDPTGLLYKLDVIGDVGDIIRETLIKESGAQNTADGAFCPS